MGRNRLKTIFKTIVLVLGSAIVGFTVFTLYFFPFFDKRDDSFDIDRIMEDVDRVVFVGNKYDPENASNPAFIVEHFVPPVNSFGVREQNFTFVNWSWFWKVFKSNSVWQLEAWHPVQEIWVDSYEGVNLNSWLNISRNRALDNGSEKITLNVTNYGPVGLRFRFKFGIDLHVKQFVNKSSNYEYSLIYPANSTENYTVFFNWSDVRPLVENGTISVKKGIRNLGGKDYFYFMATANGILGVGDSFELDPIFGFDKEDPDYYATIEDRFFGAKGTPTSNGNVQNIICYIQALGSGDNIKFGIYEYVDKNLVGYSQEYTGGGSEPAEGWYNLTIDTCDSIVSGTAYIVGALGDTDFVDIGYSNDDEADGTGGLYGEFMDYPDFLNPIISWDNEWTSYSAMAYAYYTEEEGEANQQLFSGWFGGGNLSVVSQLVSGFFSGNNVSSNEYLFDGFFSGNNITVNTQTVSGWFCGGNATVSNLQQLLSGWFFGNNISNNLQLLSGFFSGRNQTTISQLLTGFFSGGNLSSLSSLTSGYFCGGNISVSTLQQIFSGWFGGRNQSSISVLTDGFFSGGNLSVVSQLVSGFFSGNNVSSNEYLFDGWYSGGNITVNAPQFSNVTPTNGSTTTLLYSNWSIVIIDVETFNWTIECDNGQNNSGNDSVNGTFYLNLTGLVVNTLYTVWVNATDGNLTTREYYIFTVLPPSVPPTTGGGGGLYVPPPEEEEDIIPTAVGIGEGMILQTGFAILGLLLIFAFILFWKRRKKDKKRRKKT